MAGSTNFLVFNPTDTTNTDSDTAYAAEAQRTAGIQNGIAITSMHNKFYRQVSVMVAAFGQYMASLGQTVSDADVNALETVIANSFAATPLTPATLATATYALDTGIANAYAVTLASAPTVLTAGMPAEFLALHANTGACTLSLNSLGVKSIKMEDGSDLGANTIHANSIVKVYWDGTYWRLPATGLTTHLADDVPLNDDGNGHVFGHIPASSYYGYIDSYGNAYYQQGGGGNAMITFGSDGNFHMITIN